MMAQYEDHHDCPIWHRPIICSKIWLISKQVKFLQYSDSTQPHRYFIGAVRLGKWEENHFWAELLRIMKKFNLFQNQSYFRIYDWPTSYCAIMVVPTALQVLIGVWPPWEMGRKSLLGWIIENVEEIQLLSKSIIFSNIWSADVILGHHGGPHSLTGTL